MLHIGFLLRNVICRYFHKLFQVVGLWTGRAHKANRTPSSVETSKTEVLPLERHPVVDKYTAQTLNKGGLPVPSSQTLTALRHGRFHPSWFRLRSTAGDGTRKQQRSDLSRNLQTHSWPCLSSGLLSKRSLFVVLHHILRFLNSNSLLETSPHTHASHSHRMAQHSRHFETKISRKMTQNAAKWHSLACTREAPSHGASLWKANIHPCVFSNAVASFKSYYILSIYHNTVK